MEINTDFSRTGFKKGTFYTKIKEGKEAVFKEVSGYLFTATYKGVEYELGCHKIERCWWVIDLKTGLAVNRRAADKRSRLMDGLEEGVKVLASLNDKREDTYVKSLREFEEFKRSML